MKTIYLCERPINVERVYDATEKCYTKNDILKNPLLYKDTEYIFSTWGMPQFSAEEIKTYLPNLEAVFYGAGTVQGFARPFLECGVKIFSAWAANAVPVAEYTVAQIVLANKGFYSSSRILKSGNYSEARKNANEYPGNFNLKIGIIGAGMIGKLVINMLKSYKFDLLVFDPFLPDEKANELKVEKTDLHTIFSECQVVSNHLANNEQTKNMLNKALFDAMPPYATFINTGRGAQVVESDLIEVLKSRPDLTAILDVTNPEPPAEDSEFFNLPNCILTPHIAGSMGLEVKRMGEYMKKEYENFINKKPLKYEVTSAMLETMA